MVQNTKVCLVIPAFNEAPRIGKVLSTVISSGCFTQIIVVDDGSLDDTAKEAYAQVATARNQDIDMSVIIQGENQGKAAAMKTGVEATDAGIICFIDADLTGITIEHIRDLVTPVVGGRFQAARAIFKGGRKRTDLAQQINPDLTGQRCLDRDLLRDLNWGSNYQIEKNLEWHVKSQGVKFLDIAWEGASQVTKEEKFGLLAGWKKRLSMYCDILSTYIRR